MADPLRGELGDFLRSRRERLTPSAVGLPPGTRRRRTPGLRREEVAELAGIGVDWYLRLEQGRSVSPSGTTLEALARALRLDGAERTHLLTLARAPGPRRFAREAVPKGIRRVVEALPHPAYVTGRRWDLLAWNTAAEDVFGFGVLPTGQDNILLYVLTDPRARRLFGDGWIEQARRMVAQFRSVYDLWAGDPAFADLLARLRAGCVEFSTWWDAHDVRGGGTGRKLLYHPAHGPLSFDYATFQANDDPALRLAIYAPA